MQFRWANLLFGWCDRIDFFFLLFLTCFCPSLSQAILYVSPSNGGSIAGQSSGGGSFYYFVNTGSTPIPTYAMNNAFLGSGFIPLMLTPTTNVGSDAPGYSNYFEVIVWSSASVQTTGTQVPAIYFSAFPTSQTVHPAPIAFVNGSPCAQGTCLAYNQVNGLNHYYAAVYPGNAQQVRIGFYPNDICEEARLLGVLATGCSSTAPAYVTTPSVAPGSPSSIQVAFSLGYSADGYAAPTTALETMQTPITLSFQVDTPSLVCPAQSQLQQIYTPGDTQIFLDPTQFGISNPSGAAPAANLIIVGQDTSVTSDPPKVDESYNTGANSLVSTGPFYSPLTVNGFSNYTPSTPHTYTLSFLVQDASGLISAPAPGACTLSGVRTASIEGFLKEGCFIATAAFGTEDALPVKMLRKFRSKVLSQFSLGRQLIRFYYKWSPQMASWVEYHPVFRIPTLLMLIPIQGIAWMFLHFNMVLLLVGALGSGYILGNVFRKHRVSLR